MVQTKDSGRFRAYITSAKANPGMAYQEAESVI